MEIEVLTPHGLCAGVDAAIALAMRHRDAYCLRHLVHNEIVTGELKALGYTFVNSIEEVPDGETVVFPAHGVTPEVRERAKAKGLNVVDATCPFVARAHRAARDFSARGLPVVVLGDRTHVEVEGILGEIADKRQPSPGEAIGVVSQTTMNADEVHDKIEALRKTYRVEGVADVCTATKERQDAVRRFDGDALLVLGSRESANTRRLCEIARCPVFTAGNMDEVRKAMDELERYGRVGVTSGASTPERFFERAVNCLRHVLEHVAIVMDGSERWAEMRGKPPISGHVAGARTLVRTLERLGERGIRHVTIYPFYSEKGKRPAREVAGLMRIFATMLKSGVGLLVEKGIRLRVIGRRDDLPPRLRESIAEAERRTAAFDRQLIVCINYGGRAEIVDAANAAIARDEKVTEETFRRLLYAPDVPDPDLIIRTGGAHSPGDFLLWQSAYSAYRFTDTLWPDFSDLP